MGDPRRIAVAVVALCRSGSVLVRRRSSSTDPELGGTWEFPGGKVEPGEAPLAAALRELLEEAGVVPATLALERVVDHRYPDRSLRIHFYRAAAPPGWSPPHPWRWMSLETLLEAPIPAANREIIRALLEPRAKDG